MINRGSAHALNVTVTWSFVGNLILKQPNIITLEKWHKVRISRINQVMMLKNAIIIQNCLRTLKFVTVKAILMFVLAFGKMRRVTSMKSSNGPFSWPTMFSKIMTINWVLLPIHFFKWDQTMTCSTFALKIKTALQLNWTQNMKIKRELWASNKNLIGLASFTLIWPNK